MIYVDLCYSVQDLKRCQTPLYMPSRLSQNCYTGVHLTVTLYESICLSITNPLIFIRSP